MKKELWLRLQHCQFDNLVPPHLAHKKARTASLTPSWRRASLFCGARFARQGFAPTTRALLQP